MKYVLEVIFPYIFLLYVFDCITYVKARHVLLTALIGKRFKLKRSGVHLAGLLPISQTVISHNLPIVYTPDGIYAVFDESHTTGRIDKAEDFKFIKFKDLASVEVQGKNIKFNNTHTIKTPSLPGARFHAEFINKLILLSPADRKEKIQAHLSDSYDLKAIRKIDTANSKLLAVIKILSSYLFGLVFLVLPAALFSNLSGYINLNALVICILLIYFPLLLVSFVSFKKLYPSEKEIRSNALLSIIFAPVNAIHVLGYLTRDLYFRFNYMAIAAYFMPQDSLKELARKESILIDYFEKENDRQDWPEFWRLKKELLQGLLVKCEISPGEISIPPEKQDQTAVYYCPFCMTEYSEKRHHCLDCEIALKEFDTECEIGATH